MSPPQAGALGLNGRKERDSGLNHVNNAVTPGLCLQVPDT
jgi:hypothetical protein